MGFKQLGVVKDIVEAAGMGVSYVYDDLVFLEHNSFLLQFSKNDREIQIHVNVEADKEIVNKDIAKIQELALRHEMTFSRGSEYSLSQDDDENIRIEFHKAN